MEKLIWSIILPSIEQLFSKGGGGGTLHPYYNSNQRSIEL